jgi:hypothetical protein
MLEAVWRRKVGGCQQNRYRCTNQPVWFTVVTVMAIEPEPIHCSKHGEGFATFVCEHLVANPIQPWHGGYPTEESPWPDSWCSLCHQNFLKEGEWNEKNEQFIAITTICHHCFEEAQNQSVLHLQGKALNGWKSLLDLCMAELKFKQDLLEQQYILGNHNHWEMDQETGELVFSNDGVPAVKASIEFAGSISMNSGTWLWSWANFSVFVANRSRIEQVRTFGETQGFPHLTVPKWVATQSDGWEMASISTHLLDARGVYRMPSSTGFSFLLLTDIWFVQ